MKNEFRSDKCVHQFFKVIIKHQHQTKDQEMLSNIIKILISSISIFLHSLLFNTRYRLVLDNFLIYCRDLNQAIKIFPVMT